MGEQELIGQGVAAARRRFATLLGLALPLAVLLSAMCVSAEAQPADKVARIGVLVPTSRAFFLTRFTAFREGLRVLGYVEGKNVVFEYRHADGKLDRLPGLAAELVRAKVDLIFTASGEAVLAAKKATSTIPIVFGTVQDPLADGLVDSLARPGGNVTGLSALAQELHGKRLALLKETTPGIVRVALLWSAASQGASVSLREARAAAQTLGIQIQSVQVREPKDLEGALDAIKQQRAQALLTAPDPAINAHGARIVEFAARNRLPAIYAAPEFVQAGGLMAYAPNYGDMWRRAATYADKILKGARPADLPVEQPTKFEFIVNLKAAKQIGLTIPPAVLGRADRIIE